MRVDELELSEDPPFPLVKLTAVLLRSRSTAGSGLANSRSAGLGTQKVRPMAPIVCTLDILGLQVRLRICGSKPTRSVSRVKA